MRTQSGVGGNTAQSPCTKSSAISYKFKDIKPFRNKLTSKTDDSLRLLFKNINGIPPDMGYCPSLWKYKRLKYMQSRFQADILNLVEIQINSNLTRYTFSLSNKLLNNQNPVSILSNNINKLLGMR